jgi:16S rRNA (guanine527-N7)-methyltransferase
VLSADTPSPLPESVEPMPAGVMEAFGPAASLLQRYAYLLVGPAVARGLLGPAEPAKIWRRHLLNCAALAPLVPEGVEVTDVGSGAGLPGLVLAIVRADLSLTLLEPMARRATFLTECVTELNLERRVHVRRARAQDCAAVSTAGPRGAPVVVARALASLRRLIPMSMPLLEPGGVLLALKGQRATEEIASAQPLLSRYRLHATVRTVSIVGVPGTVVVVRHAGDEASS